ncbi:type II toxin-antitoxin system death-on-curing family toxin [Pleomorphomonas sp. JP5]|uniref:type II toxin-antitoxin system death-on-curing family toxin n=1 Tax=Pleomorphomonas sp. JP5 TaxID=2942998 RepID=UPI002043FE02|nr:type II toxin-antitoxin system death-on-curing family toxin [Pleomorphomonas sp. JP5]MCM5557575.1 type II toxin-antitoxin system death-on-curing family toxin [Pleomorphomonas sp. JP5]
MFEFEPKIQVEFERAIAAVENFPEPSGPNTISTREVITAHFQIANHFYLEGNGLGGVGPKDLGLLHSAVFRQVFEFDGKKKWTTPFEVCATLLYGLIKNHPFHDANKRTAFLCAVFQLQKFGWCLSVPGKTFEDFTVEISDNKLDRYSRYCDLKKSGDTDPEINFISWFIKSSTRKIDKREYTVTYKQLQAILKRYGFDIVNPNNNYINIVRIEKRGKFLGFFGTERTVEYRLGQIGFPRWTAQVRQGALKTVREVTGLTAKQGVDSAAFFHGVDSMQSLVGVYHQPLMNLANR